MLRAPPGVTHLRPLPTFACPCSGSSVWRNARRPSPRRGKLWAPPAMSHQTLCKGVGGFPKKEHSQRRAEQASGKGSAVSRPARRAPTSAGTRDWVRGLSACHGGVHGLAFCGVKGQGSLQADIQAPRPRLSPMA